MSSQSLVPVQQMTLLILTDQKSLPVHVQPNERDLSDVSSHHFAAIKNKTRKLYKGEQHVYGIEII